MKAVKQNDQSGYIELDNGDRFWTPIPPSDNTLREVFDKFIEDGGEVEEEPTPIAPAQSIQAITTLQFLELFTQQERIKIRKFSRTDDLADDWLTLLNAAGEVQKDDPRTMGGLQYMVSKNVLTQERVQEILDAMPT